ncbi:MAG: ABC transporter ATP-binding protein [Steroidobacteraceae bacterium]
MSIALDQVTKRYQSAPVVNDVSLEIEQGEFLVLLGPSGSGKSTLLRAIAGLVDMDHGRISLHGRDVTRVPARDRGVGFVFQHYALFRHMSIADNIEFALRVRRVRAAERRARRTELLKLVALEGMDKRMPGQLSGGQQQRVAVARALAHRPDVLLLDEPFGALDAKIREELRRTIRQIQRELGITTILVTHDQDEAFAMADRIGVMHQGRLLEVGKPDDLYARPRTRFVATFLGAANLVLGYRNGNGVQFERPDPGEATPREVVAVIRPEEIEFTNGRSANGRTLMGGGVVHELQFGGATERLRVRMSQDGPIPATPDCEGATEDGWLLDASRSFPEQRANPLAAGDRVFVSAKRIHLLPTPISSFTVIAREEAVATALRMTPLLATLATRMQTRITARIARSKSAPPGMSVLAAGPGSMATAQWNLAHGATQVLVLPVGATLPSRVVVLSGAEASAAVLAVAASLLRHVPAESVLLAIHPAATPERERTAKLRRLLNARSRALNEHGLDMRTELRFGQENRELESELSAAPQSMLVLGLDSLADAEPKRLAALLEGPRLRPVLIVRASGGDG